jgi:glycerol-3-phosphate dehydrogenase
MDRNIHLSKLSKVNNFDIIVIGGGATGAGIALDASSRGLNVLLVEKNDFGEGTSSRSTKLIHGGVRYLEKAIKHLSLEQYNLVKEGLHERGIFLKNAPHISKKIPFIIPIYKWFELPYVFAGLKLYDILSGKMRIGKSQILSKTKTIQHLPMLNEKKLKGGILYYDGQFNDARMVISLIKTASKFGATVLNYMEVVNLIKENNKICGVILQDKLTSKRYRINSTSVVNATGPFTDNIRKIDDPNKKNIVKTSSGIHIVLDKKFAPVKYGMMIPKTDDGRIIFVIPWENHTLIGTTDNPCPIQEHPIVLEEEINYVLKQVGKYFKTSPKKSDILSSWSGIRPLVFDSDIKNTQELARSHLIEISSSGLITITGGKWTSYRKMAEDTVSKVIEQFNLNAKDCMTYNLQVIGGEHLNNNGYKYLLETYNIETDTAIHLHQFYGSEAEKVIKSGNSKNNLRKLLEGYPYIEAEVHYAVEQEMAIHVTDFIIRRITIALLNIEISRLIAYKTLEIMSKKLNWSENKIIKEKIMIEERLNKSI